MYIFITGASGYIGKEVTRAVSAAGLIPLAIGKEQARLPIGVKTAVVDLTSGAGLDLLPWSDCAAVIHLAAAGVKVHSRKLAECIAVNILGTQRLLDAISSYSAGNVLILGRTYYEDYAGAGMFSENAYVLTKAAATELTKKWSQRNPKHCCVGARIFQVYGPGDDPRNVLPYVAARLSNRLRVELGSGRGEKDWIYISDAASAILGMIGQARPGWKDFDVGTGELTSVRTMAEKIADIAGDSHVLLEFDPSKDRPDVDVKAKATRLLPGWAPRVSVNDGLRRLFEEHQVK